MWLFLEKTVGLGTLSLSAEPKVVSIEETEGSHISSDRQWKKLVSELLAHQVLSTLLYAVKKLEV